MDDAVEEVDNGSAAVAPVPPCIVLLEGGAGVRVVVDDRGAEVGLVSLRTDDVLVQTVSSVAQDKCNTELLDFLAKALAVRRSTLTVRPSLLDVGPKEPS
jgi:hypothetical protein